MLETEKQTHWSEMYVYASSIVADLQSATTDFLAEYEHANELVALCTEVSSDTVDDVEAWKEKRKTLLLVDLTEYLVAFLSS